MEVHILTIFPEMFHSPLQASILQRAQERGLLRIQVHNLRDFTTDRHHVTDDAPYGGGAGMIMKPGPIVTGIQEIQARFGQAHVILLSPQGTVLTHDGVTALAQHERLLLICGRYGGVDARVQAYVQAEISIGDYVLTGGELPAMVLLDAVGRQVPGVLGDYHSVQEDSLFHGLLQGPQYTRPVEFAGVRVPDILLSGNHAAILQWRRQQALWTTLQRRPDLLQHAMLTPQERAMLRAFQPGEVEPHAQ
jgi:tRNA (guanine37-N1)-methyltransferase